ncbi:hypothetical protein VdG1_00230 [Verticillium dahliae VDG1]|nr:hypothetical protein VdG1_00230 [Verticillium dahliae VDG1]
MRFETYPFDVFYSSLGNALMTQMRGRRKDRRLVQHDIARWVEKFISSPNPRVIRWRSVIANLSRNVGDFHKLPLCFAHPFLTGETIIVNSDFTKDDEGRYRVDVVREFDMAERHFWASVFGSLDKASKAEATGNISLIQDAFRLSTLLNYFPLDADDEPQPPSRLLVENLPFFLSYRIPQVRGPQDVAFDDELEERIENWLCKPTANGQAAAQIGNMQQLVPLARHATTTESNAPLSRENCQSSRNPVSVPLLTHQQPLVLPVRSLRAPAPRPPSLPRKWGNQPSDQDDDCQSDDDVQDQLDVQGLDADADNLDRRLDHDQARDDKARHNVQDDTQDVDDNNNNVYFEDAGDDHLEAEHDNHQETTSRSHDAGTAARRRRTYHADAEHDPWADTNNRLALRHLHTYHKPLQEVSQVNGWGRGPLFHRMGNTNSVHS